MAAGDYCWCFAHIVINSRDVGMALLRQLAHLGSASLVSCLALGPTSWNWESNSTAWLILMVIFNVVVFLFLLWSIYLLLRFVIAFARATIQASRKWKRDDHALPRLST
jgi:hypothetical protein